MNEAILIWLYLGFGNVLVTAWVILLSVTGVGAVMSLAYQAEKCHDDPDFWTFWQKYYPFKTALLVSVLFAFYPSQNDLKYIIGGALVWNGAQAASEIEGVQKLPENLVGAMNHFLEQVQEK